ncbi:hypothetical protein UlMin_007879 [Ulmus minor]
MAKSLVNSYQQRLESLLLEEKEAFAGVEDVIERIANKLGEIGRSFDDSESTTQEDDNTSWVKELREIINDVENHVESFLGKNERDKKVLSDGFRNDMQQIDTRLAGTIQREEDTVEKIKQDYMNLSESLRSCLMYCCIFPENFLLAKGKLIRLLVAEGLIEEKEGKVMEDIAEEAVHELISQGMIQIYDEYSENGSKLLVPKAIREFCVRQIEEGNLKLSCSNSESSVPQKARRIITSLDMLKGDNHQLWSLYLIGNEQSVEEKRDWLRFSGAKSLRVLDLENMKIQTLPDEVGELIYLTYLGLKQTEITELPECLSNLKALQTLDIRWCGNVEELPDWVLNLSSLRHLKMFKNYGYCGVKIPSGIGTLANLLTLTGIDASGDIARELGNLIQLRRLGVMDVDENNINVLFSSIMKMQDLLSLSLDSKHGSEQGKLVLPESISPPPSLRKLRLEGILGKIPNWLGSLERLTKIRLGFSHLSENPALVLQLLPNLKHLILWQAYDGKQMGKEFCKAGGFPKLEILTISSWVLEEWTEIEEGALPSLMYLRLHSCSRLRMLPEGLQFVTTLKQMLLLPLLDDHAERLKPDGGLENYKIKHIPKISFMTTSMVKEIFEARRGVTGEEV